MLIAILATAGTVSNAISLSFFLRHQRESLADKHLIALNITDLLICLLSPAQLFLSDNLSKEVQELERQGEDMAATYDEVHKIFMGSFYLSLSLLSCFVTTMLSVTRTLALTKPLYLIKNNYVCYAHRLNALFILLGMSIPSINLSLFKKAALHSGRKISPIVHTTVFTCQYSYVLVTVVIVGISSVIVARALRKPPGIPTQQVGGRNRENNRKATVIILALSIIFSICNATWCLFWAIVMGIYLSNTSDTLSVKIQIFGTFLNLFPLTINSCANPVVYLVRNSRLNTYTKSLLRRLKTVLSRKIENLLGVM